MRIRQVSDYSGEVVLAPNAGMRSTQMGAPICHKRRK